MPGCGGTVEKGGGLAAALECINYWEQEPEEQEPEEHPPPPSSRLELTWKPM